MIIINKHIQKILFMICIVVVFLVSACASTGEKSRYQTLEDQWGISITGIRLSGAGYFLDFRYRVIDPDKASQIVKRDIKPYLVDNETGAVMGVPAPTKLGPLRQTSVKPYKDRVYFIMFANPGKYIKKGRKVTVVIGDVKIKDLTVE